MARFRAYYPIQLDRSLSSILEANDFEIIVAQEHNEECFIRELSIYKPDAIVCRTDPVTASMIEACGGNLKVIGKQGAGLDNIDMDYASQHGVRVIYSPAGNANAVSEHVMMLMLMCAKRYRYVDCRFREGNFLVRMGLENTFELSGKTLGLIGCGRISQLVMKKAHFGFDMKVIGFDPYVSQDSLGDLCTLKSTAKEVWSEADFVSVHLPVVDSTRRSIGREQFSWMKPNASFINCARGALVREEELIECLKDGTLFQAGLDVFDKEPIKEESRELYRLENALITPHMAATTEQAIRNCCVSTANDVVAVCTGKTPAFPANKPNY